MDSNEQTPSYKIRIPIPKPTPLGKVEAVLASGDFLAFSRILGLRILSGRSENALRMLLAIGASGATAYAIIEGWRAAEENYDASPLLSPSELGAVYLSRFVDDLAAYDWIELLKQAVTGAASEVPK